MTHANLKNIPYFHQNPFSNLPLITMTCGFCRSRIINLLPIHFFQNLRSLLHWTVLSGRDRLFEYLGKQLIKEGQLDKFINLEDDTKATPLILAVLGGNIEIVKHLLNHGANINHRNWQGHSALQYACSKGKKDIVELLLERTADVNIVDNRGDTCLHRLASTGREELLTMMLKRPDLKVLNAQNAEGNTVLHNACEDDHAVIVNLLLDTPGIDYKIENKEEKTILDLCKIPLRRRIIEKLKLGEGDENTEG